MKNRNRRDFLKYLIGTSAYLSLGSVPFELIAKKGFHKLTILYTNDVHSHIDPFPDNDPKFPSMGGVVSRAALIRRIRNEEKNVLLFDAGDIFQGTPYFNRFGGVPELKLMSMMGYDAATIGNHDFDNGIDGIVKVMPNMNFPFICSNYDFSSTAMAGKTVPYRIFEKEGIRIGVFGLGIELEGLVPKNCFGKTFFLDPVQKAAEMAFFLKKEMKCPLVICLSHLGYFYKSNKISDHALARQSKNIDLIIGGHTHTFLDSPPAYRNKENKEIFVCQVGWAGLKLGRIDAFLEGNLAETRMESTIETIRKKTSEI
ncbi:MAG: metallophosphatase [Bacteroidetes bacterium]|nr:metallophosphatase [Bacteroidota bacterium]